MSSSQASEFQDRTKRYALRVVRLSQSLPDDREARTLGHQLLRAGTSVGANYRAACRARSPAEFRSKLGICEEECDESIYWIELLVGGGFVDEKRVEDLVGEANEILAVIVASIKTSRGA